MSETDEKINAAFTGESKAGTKYRIFAERAMAEEKENVARLFMAISEAERIHSRNHMDSDARIGDTVENLQEAIEGENYEHTEMYPEFMQVAKKEDRHKTLTSFRWAKEVEEKHEELYKEALKRVKAGKDLEQFKIYVCDRCGYTVKKAAPEKCPVCSADNSLFKEF